MSQPYTPGIDPYDSCFPLFTPKALEKDPHYA